MYEIINDGLSMKPDIKQYQKLHPTHHQFRTFYNSKGWGVKAIPRKNWKEISEAELKAFMASS